jgi:hypothetical protein
MTEILAWPSYVAPSVIMGAFGFAAMAGIFFGWYPASKAAKNTEPDRCAAGQSNPAGRYQINATYTRAHFIR